MPSRGDSGLSLLAGGLGGVPHQPLEHGEIFQEAAAAELGQAATGMGAVALITLGDLDETGLLKHLQMPARDCRRSGRRAA